METIKARAKKSSAKNVNTKQLKASAKKLKSMETEMERIRKNIEDFLKQDATLVRVIGQLAED